MRKDIVVEMEVMILVDPGWSRMLEASLLWDDWLHTLIWKQDHGCNGVCCSRDCMGLIVMIFPSLMKIFVSCAFDVNRCYYMEEGKRAFLCMTKVYLIIEVRHWQI